VLQKHYDKDQENIPSTWVGIFTAKSRDGDVYSFFYFLLSGGDHFELGTVTKMCKLSTCESGRKAVHDGTQSRAVCKCKCSK
jgi:hypothetical protein